VERFEESIRHLIEEAATNLPGDLRRALTRALEREPERSRSAVALKTIAINVDSACERRRPICQDTGLLTFEVKVPPSADQLAMSSAIAHAVAAATRAGTLRPNSVDSLTGRNSGDNLGAGSPVVHFEDWLSDEIEVRLMLKGGGCENKSTQYSLPCDLGNLGRADRDLEGVRKCVLHAVHQAQGEGCSAGILGIAIGGDRASGYHNAKLQLFRTLDDVNPDATLAGFESQVLREANALGIGTMGLGGAVTLLGCKATALNRVPASFFVTVSYSCWALRRQGVVLDAETGAIKRFLDREETRPQRMTKDTRLPTTGRELRFTTPLSEAQARSLKVGDVVLLSGVIHTGRDALHRHLLDHASPVDLGGGAIYHCGPVALREGDAWTLTAAGPTTSIREEPYQADVLRKFGIRAVIGKGGMGLGTLAALGDVGAVYLSAVGGAAQYYADCVTAVLGVDFLEFGVPEAMWHLQVQDFPTIVTMDAWGGSLHADVRRSSARELTSLLVRHAKRGPSAA
jgi:fumarate hydratase class I